MLIPGVAEQLEIGAGGLDELLLLAGETGEAVVKVSALRMFMGNACPTCST